MHDVFISYAHIDDEPPVGAKLGWVSTFTDELEKELRKKTGGATIWRDHRLASNEQVTPALLEAVRSSRTLVLFLSPSYQKSRWCQSELGAFLESNPARNNRESVFIVEIEPVDRHDWHPRLREVTPLSLFVLEKDDIPRRLGHPVPKLDEDNLYWQMLNELAHLISRQLARCTAPPPAGDSGGAAPAGPAPPPAPLPSARPAIWVAEPSSDLIERWDDLARSLRQAGWDLRPPGVRSYDRHTEGAFESAVRRDLEASRLFVQLLSGAASADAARFAVLQAQAAREAAAERGIPFLQWLPEGTQPAGLPDEGYRQLLAGIVASGFEEFRALLLSKAREVEQAPVGPIAPRPARLDPAGDPALAICVSAEKHDKALGEEVARILEGLGQEALPTPDPSPEQLPADYNALLDQVIEGSSGLIIVYGKCPPAWVQAQYVRARKVLSQSRRGLWGALVEGPPKDKPRPGVPSRSIMPLDCTEGPRPDAIAQFVESLREAGRA